MPLTAGTRVGPYEILAPLGAGGMGEVYRARDPRLNRDVAIKTLPELFSDRPGRHLVLELIPGESLAQRLEAGSLLLPQRHIVVHELKTGSQKVVAENTSFPKYVPTGHLIFMQGGRLVAARWNATARQLDGAPVPLD